MGRSSGVALIIAPCILLAGDTGSGGSVIFAVGVVVVNVVYVTEVVDAPETTRDFSRSSLVSLLM